MKKLIAVMLFCMSLFTCKANSQTRIQIGVAGAQAFDNSDVGVTATLEVPFAKRFEISLSDTFSPLESHVGLGGGRANITNATGRIWFGSWGLNGQVEDSMYDVTKVTKDADYAFGGVTKRATVGGAPARFSFDYIRQFNNGITPSGLESSHLQGFDFGYTMRFGCVGSICIRTSEDFVAGAVKTQGNPQCDGQFGGPITCARSTALGGGVKASITVEFPRHRGHEYDVF
jgi:hypothetical protein